MDIKLFEPQAIFELGQRDNQEDNIFPALGKATEHDRLFVVCDGMGGHEHGEVASKAICDSLSSFFNNNVRPDEVLNDETFLMALDYAYKQLDAVDDGAYQKMGTTLTMLYFHPGGCLAAHIGDSRIYHIRPSENRIIYQSRDHSLVMDLYQSGEISFDEMATHPRKNVITKAMMPGEDNRVRPDLMHITDIQPGDFFFLCSDGMLEETSDAELLAIIAGKGGDNKKVKQLIAASSENKDNHSAYLIHIKDVALAPSDMNTENEEATSPRNLVNIRRRIEETAPEAVEITPIPPTPPEKNPNSQKLLKWVVIALMAIVAAVAIGWTLGKGGNNGDKTKDAIKFENKEQQRSDSGGIKRNNVKTLEKEQTVTNPTSPIAKPKPSSKPISHDSSSFAKQGVNTITPKDVKSTGQESSTQKQKSEQIQSETSQESPNNI